MKKLFLLFLSSALCAYEKYTFQATPCNSLAYILAVVDAQASLPLLSQKLVGERVSPSRRSADLWRKYDAICSPEERDVSKAVYALHRRELAQSSRAEINRQYAAVKDGSMEDRLNAENALAFDIPQNDQLQACAYLQAISLVAHERAPELVAQVDQVRAGCGKNTDTFLGKAYYHLMRDNLKNVSDETVACELRKKLAD